MKLTLHSDEINVLIYNYLQESGFIHTAFSFGAEANLTHPMSSTYSVPGEKFGIESKSSSIADQLGARLPPNFLITMLQKALLYVWIEHHTDSETGDEILCNQPFGIFCRHDCRYDSVDSQCLKQPNQDVPARSSEWGGAAKVMLECSGPTENDLTSANCITTKRQEADTAIASQMSRKRRTPQSSEKTYLSGEAKCFNNMPCNPGILRARDIKD